MSRPSFHRIPLQLLLFCVIAIAVHALTSDFRLLGNESTAWYLSWQEFLLTLIFIALLSYNTYPVWKGLSSIEEKGAFVFLFLALTFSVYFGIKVTLYPYDIEDKEGNLILQGIQFWRNPSQLYPNPEVDAAVAYMYPPIAGILWGSTYQLTGYDLFYPRLFSFMLILMTGCLLPMLIECTRLTQFYIFSGWLALQSYFSGALYPVEVDSLLVFLLVSSLLCFRRYLSNPSFFLLGLLSLLLVVAIFTKQHALFVWAGLTVVLLFKADYKGALCLSLMTLIPVVIFTYILSRITDGWFVRTILLGLHHGLSWRDLAYLISFMPYWILVCSFYFYLNRYQENRLSWESYGWIGFIALAYIPIAILALIKGGSYSTANWAFPLAVLLLPACTLTLRSPAFTCFMSLAILMSGLYNVHFGTAFSTRERIQPKRAKEIVDLLRSTQGPILLSRHQEYLLRLGKPVHDDLGVVFWEFARLDPSGRIPPFYPKVAARINREIQSGKYELILTDPLYLNQLEPETQSYIRSHYQLTERPKGDLLSIEAKRK